MKPTIADARIWRREWPATGRHVKISPHMPECKHDPPIKTRPSRLRRIARSRFGCSRFSRWSRSAAASRCLPSIGRAPQRKPTRCEIRSPRLPLRCRNGQFLYGQHCLSCHGVNADGKGERASTISVAPANLTDRAAIGRESDGLVFWKISEGHDPMPAYKYRLSESERWDLVNYLRTVEKK